jgi:SAM-dependent methyltransferase
VFEGRSLNVLASYAPEKKFIGFDSFQGLPEDWERSEKSVYKAGHFALSELPSVAENVELVAGFFDASLPNWLEDNPGAISFVHIDADLYSSTKFVLNQIQDRLVGSAIIVFDELSDWKDSGTYPYWEQGEWRAFREWLEETGRRFRIISRGPRFEAAVEVYRDSDPEVNERWLLTRANNLFKLKQTDFSFEMAVDIATRNPQSVSASRFLVRTLLASERVAEAAEHIRTSLSQLSDTSIKMSPEVFELALIRIRLMLRLDVSHAVHEELAGLLERAPEDAKSLCDFAHAVERLQEYGLCAEAIERALELEETEELIVLSRRYDTLRDIDPEFRRMKFSSYMMQELIRNRDFKSVLDIGSGAGEQAAAMRRHGKIVTELDYGRSVYFEKRPDGGELITGDFMEIEFTQQYDCVIASHVLEHQLNVNAFLKKMHAVLREGGVVAITVPPLKHSIVGGHLTLWNAGLLLYNLVLAGFDCRNAWVRKYGYNISVVLEKRTVEAVGLVYDSGDIDRISSFMPIGFREGFDGDIARLN